MGGILGRMAMEFTWWTTRGIIRALFELPPAAYPPTMEFMTSRPLLQLSLGGSSLLPRCSRWRLSSLGCGLSSLVLPPCKRNAWWCGRPAQRAQVPCLNKLLYFVFQGLALLGRMTGVLMIPTFHATVGVIRTQSPSGWRDQLCAKGFLQYFPSIGVEGCVLWEPRPTIVSFGIVSSRPRPSLSLLLILLLAACFCPSLVPELAQLFQLHVLSGWTPKFVQTCRRLHAQAVCERTRSESSQHMMHCHLGTEVPNTHSDLPKPVDQLSQGFSLLLADADQSNGR